MKILFIYSDNVTEWNCSEHRISIPFRAMRRLGVPCEAVQLQEWEPINPRVDGVTNSADLLIIQRNLFGATLQKIAYYKTMGKAVVVDFDDAYHHMGLDTGSPSSEFWANGFVGKTVEGYKQILDPLPLKQIAWGAKLAGAVSSPSQILCDDWRLLLGVKTYLLPNYIEPWIYQYHDVYRDPGQIFLGGGGSMSHMKSWEKSGAVEAVIKLMREDKRIHLVIAGDERVAKMFRHAPPSRIHRKGWLPYALYSRSLSYVDVGLLPLAGDYDLRRSNIKPVEYSCMGIPWVGSDYPSNHLEFGSGILVENTIDEWYTAIKAVVNNLTVMRTNAINASDFVKDYYSVDRNAGKLLATYQRIVRETT